MKNVSFDYRPGMEPGYARSSQRGVHRFHVCVDRDGTPAETIFRNPIVDEHGLAAQYDSAKHDMQKAISEASEMLGKELPELRREAEQASLQRETQRKERGQDAAELTRFRIAFAEALSPYPNLADRFASFPDEELLKIGQALLRRM